MLLLQNIVFLNVIPYNMYGKLHSFEWSFFIISSACRYAEAHSKNSDSSAEHCSCDEVYHVFTSHSRIVASHIGSNTCRIHCCISLSIIVGIPSGRFLVGSLDFGISTVRTVCGVYHLNFYLTYSISRSSCHFARSFIFY